MHRKKLAIQSVLALTAVLVSTYLFLQRRHFIEPRTVITPIEKLENNIGSDKDVSQGDSKEEENRELLWKNVNERPQGERQKRVADVIGLGVKKCGTGALISFLGEHPLIKLPPKRVETFFFSHGYTGNAERYKRLMPEVTDDELSMEKSPGYFYVASKIIPRIKMIAPNAKLILSLCNPVKRAFSDFVHVAYPKHKEDEQTYFAEAFDALTNNVLQKIPQDGKSKNAIAQIATSLCKIRSKVCPITKGIYQYSMQIWLDNFNSSQLLIINGDKWITDPGGLIEEIQDFLKIPKLILREDFVLSPGNGFYCLNRWWMKNYNFHSVATKNQTDSDDTDKKLFCLSEGKGRTRNGVRSMLPTTYEKLRQFYEPYNILLYRMLNENMSW